RRAWGTGNRTGVQGTAPVVSKNLIKKKEMPVTTGVFVRPGVVKATANVAGAAPVALDRFNRSFEYDGLGDNYARFILEELLPEVEKKTTSDGRPIKLSQDGNDRGIGGSSNGAPSALTAARARPGPLPPASTAIGTHH